LIVRERPLKPRIAGLMATSAILLVTVTCFGISDTLKDIGGYLQ
jgi:hypothetical protein